MEPRILSRTHYQVDEPAYMTLMCKLCTSGAKTAYREVVGQKLADTIRDRGKDFNTAAGGYAVDLAKALGLITPEHALAEKGHLVNLIGLVKDGQWEEQLTLTPSESLLYFRLFLEADGAAMVFLARRVLEDGRIPSGGATWNSLATEMFTHAYSSYLEITNNTADRVALRQHRDRLRIKGYEGRGGEHKMAIHVQTLFRLGLIGRLSSGRRRIYTTATTAAGQTPLELFTNEVRDIVALERIVQRREWARVAARVFGVGRSTPSQSDNDSLRREILRLIVPYYERILATGAPLCPLGTLIDVVQIQMLTGGDSFLTYQDVVKMLTVTQKESPKDVRFHVDRRGRPAFLKLSDKICRAYSS